MGVGPDEFQHHEEHWISSSSKLETKGTGRVPSDGITSLLLMPVTHEASSRHLLVLPDE